MGERTDTLTHKARERGEEERTDTLTHKARERREGERTDTLTHKERENALTRYHTRREAKGREEERWGRGQVHARTRHTQPQEEGASKHVRPHVDQLVVNAEERLQAPSVRVEGVCVVRVRDLIDISHDGVHTRRDGGRARQRR